MGMRGIFSLASYASGPEILFRLCRINAQWLYAHLKEKLFSRIHNAYLLSASVYTDKWRAAIK
jgi:hypothetical protein